MMETEEGFDVEMGRGRRGRGGAFGRDFVEADDMGEMEEEEEEYYDDDDDDDYEEWGDNDPRMATPTCCWVSAVVALVSAVAVCLVIFSVELYTLNHPTETATYYEDLVTVILMIVLTSIPLMAFVGLCFCGIVLKIQDIRRRNKRFARKTKPSKAVQEELEMSAMDDYEDSSAVVVTKRAPQQLEYEDEDPFGAPTAPLASQDTHDAGDEDFYGDDDSEEEEEEFD